LARPLEKNGYGKYLIELVESLSCPANDGTASNILNLRRAHV
jgi:hypothetical protein